jgi:thioredoxin reductase (NADPH)
MAEPPLSQSIGLRMDEPILDCLVIGGGPAGLTAAIYLARFHLDILVVDGGKSRASWIPCTRNHAGFPDGIEGKQLLRRMRDQACKYGAKIESEFVTKLERDDKTGHFTATWGSGSATARTILIATGISNRRPPMDEELHDDAVARGLVRYCPICDGYEVTDKRVGVIGSDSHGVAEALFLRSYTADVTLIAPDRTMRLKPEDSVKLRDAGIECVDGPAQAVAIARNCITVDTAEGHFLFESIYPALGSDTHTQLAKMVGAKLASDGCILTDAHQRSTVPCLYAAGDVVHGLDQISHAMGEGGVAATTIRNDLCAANPRWREPLQEMEQVETGS